MYAATFVVVYMAEVLKMTAELMVARETSAQFAGEIEAFKARPCWHRLIASRWPHPQHLFEAAPAVPDTRALMGNGNVRQAFDRNEHLSTNHPKELGERPKPGPAGPRTPYPVNDPGFADPRKPGSEPDYVPSPTPPTLRTCKDESVASLNVARELGCCLPYSVGLLR
jgi:hypothetical protein